MCAVTKDGYFRRVIKVHGLKEGTVASTSPLSSPRDIPAIIRVTPQMQNPRKEKSFFNPMPDENNPGRIVEFP
jgi:hypothetical protein